MTRERTRNRESGSGKTKGVLKAGSELADTIAAIKKQQGDGAILTGVSASAQTFIETGIFLQDFAMLGGIGESRVSMIYGHPGAGKTTVSARCAAALQRKYDDKAVVYVDAEGTFDMTWGKMHGIDEDRFVLSQPESGEHAVDIIDAVLRSKETGLVIIDSLPAMVPQAMIERSAEDKTMAVRSQLIGVCCSKILAAFQAERKRKHNPSVIMVNQWRSKVGFVLGNPNVLPGGAQPRYLSSYMLEVKKKKEHTGKDRFGNEINIYNEHAFDLDKSKSGSSIRQGEFVLVTSNDYVCSDAPNVRLPAGSIDDYKVVCTYAKRMGFITGGGQSYEIQGVDQKFRKLENMIEFFAENDDEFISIKRKMIAMKREENGLPAIPPDGYLLGYTREGKRRRA